MRSQALVSTCLLLAAAAAPARPPADGPRRFVVTYAVEVDGIPEGAGPVHVFVPLAGDDEHQAVLRRTVDAMTCGLLGRERRHGNLFWHAIVDEWDGRPLRVVVEYEVERRPVRREGVDGPVTRPVSRAERRRLRAYLMANDRVPVGDEILRPILDEVRERVDSRDKASVARGIFDWIVDNMEYKKVGTGWGHGDTHWACSARYGNCTDFHSLFISLARTEGIPARFEIGYPIPSRSEGTVAGYHCWSQSYLPRVGWIPIDASEACKAPERREQHFAVQAPDRFRLTTGRDLELGPHHRSGPLNYFVTPLVEVDGVRHDETVRVTVRHRDVVEGRGHLG